MKKKTKKIITISGGVLVVLLIAGTWAFYHWLGFMLVKPILVDAVMEWPMSVVAGSDKPGFADGTSAHFNKPIRLAPFGPDTILVADFNNYAIRRVHLNGEVETLAGGPDRQGHTDGPAAEARFGSPHGVAARADGTIAVTDVDNNTIRLLKPVEDDDAVAPSGKYVVSTLAGIPGKSGFRDGPVGQSLFNAPHAVVFGPEGELYVADIGNARVRKIKDGYVSTIAGTGHFGQRDGDITLGTLQYPMDLAIDDDGTVWIADAGTCTIRCWEPRRGLSTPWPDFKIDMPHGLSVTAEGGAVVAEMFANRIVLLTSEDRVMHLCGLGEKGSGSNQLNNPAAVLLHAGHIWIADLYNHRILVAQWQL